MRRVAMCTAMLLLTATACGSGVSGQPQSEEGALAAVKSASEGAFRGNVDAVLNFLSDECRDAIDESDVRVAVKLAPTLFNDLFDGFELDEITAEPTIVSYDDDTARVSVDFTTPDGVDVDTLGLTSESIDVMYDGTKWVDTGCDFEDTTAADAERQQEELAALGFEGTREDPIPRSVAAPVGEGHIVSIDAVNPDAAATIEAMGGFAAEPEPGEQFVLVSVTVGYNGTEEPQQLGSFNAQIIGGTSAVGVDSYGCGSFPTQLTGFSSKIFNGGVRSGDLCFAVPTSDVDGMMLSIEAGFGDRPVVFDPNAVAENPVPVPGSSGPSPDGSYTAARQSPTPLGEAVDIGEGWAITVLGFQGDATADILAADEFNDPPPSGMVYSLVEYELAYTGDEEPGSVFSVSVDVVGDSNVSGDRNCNVSDVPNEIDRFADVFTGGSISGNQCFIVDATDTDSLVVIANADFFSDDAFAFAVR